MKLGTVEKSEDGSEIIEFDDLTDFPCSLQSSADSDQSCIELGALDGPAILDREQVLALIGHLTRWLADGSFCDGEEKQDENPTHAL